MFGNVWIDCFCVTPDMSPLIRTCNAIGCVCDLMNAGEAGMYVSRLGIMHWASMHNHLGALLCTQNLQAGELVRVVCL